MYRRSYTISTTGNFIGGGAADTRIAYQGNLVAIIADASVPTSALI